MESAINQIIKRKTTLYKNSKYGSIKNLTSLREYFRNESKYVNLSKNLKKYFTTNKMEEIYKTNSFVNINNKTLENISIQAFRNIKIESDHIIDRNSIQFSLVEENKINESITRSNMKIFLIISILVFLLMTATAIIILVVF